MVDTLGYLLLAIVGLGFLIFIHELGHFFMAKRAGMKVEAFSIGFGKPIYSWKRGKVQWQIGFLPFGGYVKIAGMQEEGKVDPYEIPEGFFSKKPIARIKVVLMGPLVNLAFALVAFSLIWLLGGRDKNFSQTTSRIGWVNPSSELYRMGVRPGDRIVECNGKEAPAFQDLLYASFLDGSKVEIKGYKENFSQGKEFPFTYTYIIPKDKLAFSLDLLPAQYLIYHSQFSAMNSSAREAGIQEKDRIVWVDGERVFSQRQLQEILHNSTAFLSVQREGKIFLSKVPRLQIQDLKITPCERAEIDDWQHEANIKGRLKELYFIPYNLDEKARVEKAWNYIDGSLALFSTTNSQFQPLKRGDRIIAVDGVRIFSSFELLQQLQTRHVLMIIEREKNLLGKLSKEDSEMLFEKGFSEKHLQPLINSIGTIHPLSSSNSFYLLRPMVLKKYEELSFPQEREKLLLRAFSESKKEIAQIKDSREREKALRKLEKSKEGLGIQLMDEKVQDNPNPFILFGRACQELGRVFSSLVQGKLPPKMLLGPVGIIQVVQFSWAAGGKEALFWLGFISMNLGLLNLLPIPALDGGHILFALYEQVTKKRLKVKTMEKFIIPFLILLGVGLLYLTYHDLLRLFSRFF